MCMEDINLGRKSYSRKRFFSTGAGVGTPSIIGGESRRIRLVISTDGGSTLQLYLSPTVDGQTSLIMSPTASPFVMKIEDFGNQLMQPLSVNNPGAAAVTYAITETLYDDFAAPKLTEMP